MTIVAGFSATRHAPAPLNLALQLAQNTGERIVVASIVRAPSMPTVEPADKDFLRIMAGQAEGALRDIAQSIRTELGAQIETVVHTATSLPRGLLEIAAQADASVCVVGSSSAGLLGRVALGSVTERIVHTAEMPIMLAPRGYHARREPLRRITAGYGGKSETEAFIAASARMSADWDLRMRIASFSVQPTPRWGVSVEERADELVVEQWVRSTRKRMNDQLAAAREHIELPHVELATGIGYDWQQAVESIPWTAGDILVVGSGAASKASQVFLGSVASKILRHSPVPVLILPRDHQP